MELITARPHGLEKEWMRRIAACQGRAVILVPPQETLNTELRLMDGLHLSGSFELDVLSPGRLRERVFERAGRPQRIVFDDRGKQMLLCEILEEEKDNLQIYGRAAACGQESLAARLGEMIACWKRAGLGPEDMRRGEQGTLAMKLSDAALIYERYNERLAGRLADAEDILQEERERMQESRVLEGKDVFVSGFDVITPGFTAELALYERAAKSVTLFVETDANQAPDGRLYAPVNASLARMKAALEKEGISLRQTVITEKPERAPDLSALEENLYALAPHVFSSQPAHIELRAASSVLREVHLACARIRRELADGMRLSEIAVVYPKESGYASLLASVPAAYGIPVYAAEKRPAAAHPLCRFVISALRAAEEDALKTGDVLECLKSGFMEETPEAVDAFTSYCEQMEIRSVAQPFGYKLSPQMPDEALAAVEETRARTVECLGGFRRALKLARDPDGVIRALLNLLDSVKANEKLEAMRLGLQEAGLMSEAEDCAQLWNVLMETLDQLHDLLPEKTPVMLMRRMLETGLSALEISALPPASGAVLAGEIGNLRTGHLKLLLVLGMNDGEGSHTAGLFTPSEQQEIERGGVFLGLTDPEREALASLDILKAMTGAERLVVSYALSDETGMALREGEAVQALQRVFPALQTVGGLAEEELPELLCAPDPAGNAIALSLRSGNTEIPKEFSAAAAELAAMDARMMRSLAGELQKKPERRLDPEQASDLYGRDRATGSVSRLETFAACPYQYFLKYGIRPEQERKAGIDAAELGTLYHTVTENFVREAMQEPGFPALSDEKVEELTRKAADGLMEEFRKSPYGESKRGEAAVRHIRKTADRVTATVIHQYKEGKFAPFRLELVFGEGSLPPLSIQLANGELLNLRGRIDRVDMLNSEGKYIRVIDYKSSMKEVDPTGIYYGLQLQLCLYMAAALALIPGTNAAGLFYFHMKDPQITTESRIREQVEKDIAKKLSLSGVCLADVQVMRAMDDSRAAMINKDGTISARASGVLTREEMEELLRYAQRKAAELAQEAGSGLIDDAPYELSKGGRNACTFCDFREGCGFDEARKPRRLLKKKQLCDLTSEKTEKEPE